MRSPVVIFLMVLLALFVFVKEIPAQVYKYVDKDGVIHFTDTPTDPKFKLEGTAAGWNKSIRSEEKKEVIKSPPKKNSDSPAHRHYQSKKYDWKKHGKDSVSWLRGLFK